MPLNLVGRIKDAVVAVPSDSDWRGAVAAFLADLGADEIRIERHLTVLEERANGLLQWSDVLGDALLPSGRPMPPARRYAEMLVQEDRLPLYDYGALRFSLDLHNPNNEAGQRGYDSSLVEIALVADAGYFTATVPNSRIDRELPIEAQNEQRAVNGALLGELVARLVEATDANFAYADIGPTGWFVDASGSDEQARPWNFLWSINAWGKDRLSGDLAARLEGLVVTEKMLAAIDPYERPHVRIEQRELRTGALFLQYRFLFGSELRSSRTALDTPLAAQAGLRLTGRSEQS